MGATPKLLVALQASLQGSGGFSADAELSVTQFVTFAGSGLMSVVTTGTFTILPVTFSGASAMQIAYINTLGAFANFAGDSKFCIYAIVRLGPKGPTTNVAVAGRGPATNRVIQGSV